MSDIESDALPVPWVCHVDQWAGYSLAHPPGWQVLCDGGRVVAREDAAGMVEASVWPVRAPASAGAADVQAVAQKYVEWTHALDPSFEAWRIDEQEPAPGHLLLRTRSRRGPQTLEGRANITAVGSDAVIRSFHVPSDAPADSVAPPPRTPEMVKILDSFRALPAIPRQPFREPSQSAFSVLVPTGWTSSGKVASSIWTGALTLEFWCQRDPRGLTKYCVPAQYWAFMDNWLGTRFMPAAEFAATVLPKKLKLNSLRIEDSQEWPALLPHFYSEAVRAGFNPQDLEVTTACTTSTCNLVGTPVRQHMFITTSRPRGAAATSALAGQWVASLLAYYHAPQTEFASIQPVLAGIATSYRINPAWVQRQVTEQQLMSQILVEQAIMQALQAQQNFMQAQRHIWENQQQVSDMISQGWQYNNAVHDHAMHQWSNATLGRTDVADPTTGTVYSVQNDYDQYWRTNDGYIIGGSWGTQPDPSWQRLEPFRF
jgi:hypothetical protein